MSAHEWIQRKLGGDSFFKHPTSEHFLTEHGVLAASVEHSGLSPRPDAGSDLNTLAREIMKVGRNPASATSTTSSSTRSSSTSKQHGDSKGLQGCGARQVVTNVDKTRGPRRLAHAGSLAMALATAWSAMATTSVPIGGLPGTVEDASREHGGKSSFSTPPLSQSSSTTTFQSGQSGRVLLPSQSHGFGAELSGGPIADGNDGLQGCQRNGQSDQGTGSTTSRSRSQESQSRRSSGSGRERTDWPSWRIADTSQGPLEVGGIGSRSSDRQDDRGSNQAGCSTGGAEMARDNTPKKSGASSSGLSVESPQRLLEPKSLPAPESPTTTTVDQPAILQEVNSLLANQEEKFQGMLCQLMSHIMTAQQISFQASQMPGSMPMTGAHQHYIGDGVNRDLPMPSALDQSSQQGYTPEEIAQMNQDHREYLKEIGSTGKGYLSD